MIGYGAIIGYLCQLKLQGLQLQLIAGDIVLQCHSLPLSVLDVVDETFGESNIALHYLLAIGEFLQF